MKKGIADSIARTRAQQEQRSAEVRVIEKEQLAHSLKEMDRLDGARREMVERAERERAMGADSPPSQNELRAQQQKHGDQRQPEAAERSGVFAALDRAKADRDNAPSYFENKARIEREQRESPAREHTKARQYNGWER